MSYIFEYLKELLLNYGCELCYTITPKTNHAYTTTPFLRSVNYFNIVVDIRGELNDTIFNANENVFKLEFGENIITDMILDTFPTLNCHNLEKHISNDWVLKYKNEHKKWFYVNMKNNNILDRLPDNINELDSITSHLQNNLLIS